MRAAAGAADDESSESTLCLAAAAVDVRTEMSNKWIVEWRMKQPVGSRYLPITSRYTLHAMMTSRS